MSGIIMLSKTYENRVPKSKVSENGAEKYLKKYELKIFQYLIKNCKSLTQI